MFRVAKVVIETAHIVETGLITRPPGEFSVIVKDGRWQELLENHRASSVLTVSAKQRTVAEIFGNAIDLGSARVVAHDMTLSPESVKALEALAKNGHPSETVKLTYVPTTPTPITEIYEKWHVSAAAPS